MKSTASLTLAFFALLAGTGALWGQSNPAVADSGVSIAFQNSSGTVVGSGVSISFQSGAINVTTNLPPATFIITGAATYSGSGTSASFPNAAPGTYTIAFSDVVGYVTPSTQIQTLAVGGTISFTGLYIALPAPLKATPAALQFTYQQGTGTPPAPQTITVSSGGAPLVFAAAASSTPAGWLAVYPPGGTAGPGTTLTVTVTPQSLAVGRHNGSISLTAPGATNSPLAVPVILTITLPQQFSLAFPVPLNKAHCDGTGGTCTPTTVNVSAVFDHDQKYPYQKDQAVEDYRGEIGQCSSSTQLQSPVQSSWGFLQTSPNAGAAFAVNGNYTGGGGSSRAYICGSKTLGSPTASNLFLYYEGHPGYDYPFPVGTPVYPAISGCITYKLSASGSTKTSPVNQANYHVLAIIPSSTPPANCEALTTSQTGFVVFYLHLDSYVATDGTGDMLYCPSPPTSKDPSPTCPNPAPCTICPGEGTWVATSNPIAYVGNFADGLWGGVGPHLHFEVDQMATTNATPVPIDPYGWNPITAGLPDPYSPTQNPKVVNKWLWQGNP